MTRSISLFQNKFSGENLFFTSDTHFFHEGIIKFCNRPFESVEEMNETLIRNWNETVPKDGTDVMEDPTMEPGSFSATYTPGQGARQERTSLGLACSSLPSTMLA